MKLCPVCQARAFDDAETCYGCLHRFGEARSFPQNGVAGGRPLAVPPVSPEEGRKPAGRRIVQDAGCPSPSADPSRIPAASEDARAREGCRAESLERGGCRVLQRAAAPAAGACPLSQARLCAGTVPLGCSGWAIRFEVPGAPLAAGTQGTSGAGGSAGLGVARDAGGICGGVGPDAAAWLEEPDQALAGEAESLAIFIDPPARRRQHERPAVPARAAKAVSRREDEPRGMHGARHAGTQGMHEAAASARPAACGQRPRVAAEAALP